MIRTKKIPRWIFPLGVAAAGLGAAGAVLLRGCWHRSLGWPVRHGDFSYQACTDCGSMRLFDEHTFRPYGPYGYDLDELIALERARRMKRMKQARLKQPESVTEREKPGDFSI